MSMELEMARAQFFKLYASVPQKLRPEIIAIVNDRTYSWDSAFVEVHGNNTLGNEILERLEEIGLFAGEPQ